MRWQWSFRERVIEPERLDTVGREAARKSLVDLERLNRYWGGYSSLARVLKSVANEPRESVRVLDIGAASGDMGRRVRAFWPGAQVTSLDYVGHHLDGAPDPRIIADAFRLPFREQSFDYVMSSLFLHHFSGPEVIELLRGFGRTARRGVIAVDLERRALPYYFVPATRHFLGWDEITVNDAPISVAAGFRAVELRELARAAGLRNPLVQTNGIAFRVTLFGEASQ